MLRHRRTVQPDPQGVGRRAGDTTAGLHATAGHDKGRTGPMRAKPESRKSDEAPVEKATEAPTEGAVVGPDGDNPPVAAIPRTADGYDLDACELYLSRDLTWLSFNRRVMHEAADPRTPLLERVKFLAIVSGNLDEFFMKRVGLLKQLVAAGHNVTSADGRSPAQQIAECQATVREFQLLRERIFAEVLDALDEHGIGIVRWNDLDQADRKRLREHYIRTIFPLVTPLAMDPGHPFPFISNLALNLLVTMRFPDDDELRMARVKVPSHGEVAPRLLRLADTNRFVAVEDLMANNLDLLFPGMTIESCELFRVTRNANVDLPAGQADDLLQLIKSELQERHFSPIVRLQVSAGMKPVHRGMLAAELGLDEQADVFEVAGMMAMHDLFEIASLDIPELRDPPHHPVDHPRLAMDQRSIFHIIRDGTPLLMQHPYESFNSSVLRFLRTAAEDPKVLAIKMTLYRTSAEGNIIDTLVTAARNGKQVAVLVELKARFDEAANIRWANHLEEEGIHVTYGVLGLKTHSKCILVVRKDFDMLRRYAHIGTGNYHSGTARLYCDLGLMTCDDDIGADLTELFNYLTGYSPPPSYRKILAAPYTLKKALLAKIDREIDKHSNDKPGLIQFKTNALEDREITRALYRAGQVGVKVDLIVRDSCRLRPSIPGLSENIRVVSIVGRFLEHSRIYYFRNGGDEEYYIGSADLMKRNLDARVEVVAPVDDPELRENLRLMINVQLADRRSAWDMDANGAYRQRVPAPNASAKERLGSHETLIRVAEKRRASALSREQKKVRDKLYKQFRKRLNKNLG